MLCAYLRSRSYTRRSIVRTRVYASIFYWKRIDARKSESAEYSNREFDKKTEQTAIRGRRRYHPRAVLYDRFVAPSRLHQDRIACIHACLYTYVCICVCTRVDGYRQDSMKARVAEQRHLRGHAYVGKQSTELRLT